MKWIVITFCIISVAVAKDVGYDKDPENLESENGQWKTVAFFDLSHSGAVARCPIPWYKVTVNGKDMCRAPSDIPGCSSVTYHVFDTEYNRIRGYIRAYQKGTTDGFQASHDDGLGVNEAYVDGVSITIGYPRKHVWTYAAGLSTDGNFPKGNCPCAVTRGPDSPPFVRENYFCQSGSQGFPDSDTYFDEHPLWQGSGCTNAKNTCCTNVGLPWFYRRFPKMEYGDVEVRICYNQDYSDEAVLIDLLKLEVYTHGHTAS